MRGAAVALALGDVVPDDGAVEVVAAPVQGELREAHALHDPEGLDVRDVVEHQSRDGEGLRSVSPVGPGKWPSSDCSGMNERGMAALKDAGATERPSDAATKGKKSAAFCPPSLRRFVASSLSSLFIAANESA